MRGYILIDAFGLSAWHFLNSHSAFIPENFAELLGKQSKKWAQVAPDKLAGLKAAPFLILLGGKTYPIIQYDTEHFAGTLRDLKIPCELITVPGQSHMQMIYLFENANHPLYERILAWTKKKEDGV